MKTENDFNAVYGKKLRVLQPKIHVVKISDKFTDGLSDFLLFGPSGAVALENKFIKKWPSDNAKLLIHPFTGSQLTFLESIWLSGNRAYGMVAIDDSKEMFLIPYMNIPSTGNWRTKDFKDASHIIELEWLDTGHITTVLGVG